MPAMETINKITSLLVFWALLSIICSDAALAGDAANPSSAYPASACLRPDRTSIDRRRNYTAAPDGNIGMDLDALSRNEGVAAYNKGAQNYNACMLAYIAAADTEKRRVHDEAIANIGKVADESNVRIKWIERQIQAVVDEADNLGAGPVAQAADSSQYPAPDCKKPIEPKSGQHTIERTSKYDQDYRAYRTCVSGYIEGAKAEIRQLSDLAEGSMRQIAQDANIRIAAVTEAVYGAITEANKITRSGKELVAPSSSVIVITAPAASPPATESTTVSSERIPRSIDTPGGEGDPDAISCRLPQQRADSRLPGPEICKRNRDWTSLKNAGYDISPDGKSTVPTRQAGTNCTKSTAGSMYIGYITQELCK